MRIGCECSVFLKSRAGSAVYFGNLLSELEQLAPGRLRRYEYGVRAQKRTLRTRFESVLRDTVWAQALLPLRARRDHLDVLFCSTISAPVIAPCPVAVVILDVIPILHPEWFDHPWMSFQSKHLVPRIAQAATRVVTISEQSRADISATCGIDAKRIVVVSPAVDRSVFRPTSREGSLRLLSREYGIQSPFLLFVGAIEPRKNVDALIRTYSCLRQRGDTNIPLIIVGDWGWKFEAVKHALEESSFARDVTIVGFVPTSHLPHFYGAAECLVYPSSYEGFGLPVAEAMACGCPVITSPVSSIPEVAGDAALYVAPGDVEGLADAISRLTRDAALRDSCIRRGIEQTAKFSWRESAVRLYRMFEEIV